MEHSLLIAHELNLGRDGIPYERVEHLVRGRRYYDANLRPDGSTLDELHVMERNLGELDAPARRRRIAADFCCIWRYDFPQRVHEICAIIGGSEHTALRLHFQICPARRQQLLDYAAALEGWLAGCAPAACGDRSDRARSCAERVHGMLGAADPLKRLLVERTWLGLSMRTLNCSFFGHDAQCAHTSLMPFTAIPLEEGPYDRMRQVEHAITDQMGSHARPFLCEVGGAAEPACHFKFMRRVDVLVSSIGCMQWRGNLPPKDGSIIGRRALTRSYLQMLEGYWRSGQLGDGPAAEQLQRALGPPSDLTRWLVGCLWKNMADQTSLDGYPMQRWAEFVHIAEEYLGEREED